jgi:hypothetical protein
MEHLEFINKLSEMGINIRSTKKENEQKEISVPGVFKSKTILQKNFDLSWKDKDYSYEKPIKSLLAKGIDMDSWKHSWHIEMTPNNYEIIESIIQEKILDRANQIEELLLIYFQLHYEISNLKEK